MDTDEEGFATKASFTRKMSNGRLFYLCASVSIRG